MGRTSRAGLSTRPWEQVHGLRPIPMPTKAGLQLRRGLRQQRAGSHS